jgi:hypothetical protein
MEPAGAMENAQTAFPTGLPSLLILNGDQNRHHAVCMNASDRFDKANGAPSAAKAGFIVIERRMVATLSLSRNR